MKTFFSQCSQQDVEQFGSEGTFEVDGKFFYNYVEFGTNAGGTEEFTITDGCGRSVPMCVDQIDELVAVLMDIRALKQEHDHSEKLLDFINSEHNNQYVEGNAIKIDTKSFQKYFG